MDPLLVTLSGDKTHLLGSWLDDLTGAAQEVSKAINEGKKAWYDVKAPVPKSSGSGYTPAPTYPTYPAVSSAIPSWVLPAAGVAVAGIVALALLRK
jgi:hypothetical protein